MQIYQKKEVHAGVARYFFCIFEINSNILSLVAKIFKQACYLFTRLFVYL